MSISRFSRHIVSFLVCLSMFLNLTNRISKYNCMVFFRCYSIFVRDSLRNLSLFCHLSLFSDSGNEFVAFWFTVVMFRLGAGLWIRMVTICLIRLLCVMTGFYTTLRLFSLLSLVTISWLCHFNLPRRGPEFMSFLSAGLGLFLLHTWSRFVSLAYLISIYVKPGCSLRGVTVFWFSAISIHLGLILYSYPFFLPTLSGFSVQ